MNLSGGSTVGGSVLYINALAGFTDSFTFTPNDGQSVPTQVQYALLHAVSTNSSNAQSTATFNGVLIDSCDVEGTCEGDNTETITQLYSGETFESAGQVTASFEFENGEEGNATAELQLQGITMLDAQGQAVAGTLVATPEPALWPLTGLLGVGLALFAKRRPGGLL